MHTMSRTIFLTTNTHTGPRPKGAFKTVGEQEYGWANAKIPARQGKKAPITKNQPLHVDGYAEQKRKVPTYTHKCMLEEMVYSVTMLMSVSVSVSVCMSGC
jgi:hypothetical protein